MDRGHVQFATICRFIYEKHLSQITGSQAKWGSGQEMRGYAWPGPMQWLQMHSQWYPMRSKVGI